MSGHWDCHAHVFGPYEQFPLASDRSYTPPEARVADYLAMLGELGCDHGVLVHPSAYGDDFRLLMHALAAQPQWRGVVVVRPDTALDLRELRTMGVRAARFSHRSGAGTNFAGSASLQDLVDLAPRLADAGLHAELWTDTPSMSSIAPLLRQLPVPVVIDHMGGFNPANGVNDPGFAALCSLLETGTVWVKLCAYRNLLTASHPDEGRPFHQALLNANPHRLVWGSDWPHLRVEPRPDARTWLERLKVWTDDAQAYDRIMRVNPALLYT